MTIERLKEELALLDEQRKEVDERIREMDPRNRIGGAGRGIGMGGPAGGLPDGPGIGRGGPGRGGWDGPGRGMGGRGGQFDQGEMFRNRRNEDFRPGFGGPGNNFLDRRRGRDWEDAHQPTDTFEPQKKRLRSSVVVSGSVEKEQGEADEDEMEEGEERREASGVRSRISGNHDDRGMIPRYDANNPLPHQGRMEGRGPQDIMEGGITRPPRKGDIPDDADMAVPRPVKAADKATQGRNRRLLGSLLGTLSRFKEDEGRYRGSSAAAKREEALRRAEEREKQTSIALRKREREMISERRHEEMELKWKINAKTEEKRIELVLLSNAVTHHNRIATKFIKTQATPCLYFLPAAMCENTQALLDKAKADYEAGAEARAAIIEDIKQEVSQEVQDRAARFVARRQQFQAQRAEANMGEDQDLSSSLPPPPPLSSGPPALSSRVVVANTEDEAEDEDEGMDEGEDKEEGKQEDDSRVVTKTKPAAESVAEEKADQPEDELDGGDLEVDNPEGLQGLLGDDD